MRRLPPLRGFVCALLPPIHVLRCISRLQMRRIYRGTILVAVSACACISLLCGRASSCCARKGPTYFVAARCIPLRGGRRRILLFWAVAAARIKTTHCVYFRRGALLLDTIETTHGNYFYWFTPKFQKTI